MEAGQIDAWFRHQGGQLQRLYVPQHGRILVDGVNISDIDLAWLRRRIGAVTPDTVLFNGAVRENISASSPNLFSPMQEQPTHESAVP